MKILLVIIIAICVTSIYDARRIAEKYYSNSDKNKAVKLIKLSAFVIAIICGIILCLSKII